MARHNEVRLLGYVTEEPSLKRSKGDKGELLRVTMRVRTMRGIREFGESEHRKGYDEHLILTQNTQMMNLISRFHKYNIVEIKGNLITIMGKGHTTCTNENCKHVTVFPEVQSVINPIFITPIDPTKDMERMGLTDSLPIAAKIEQFLRIRTEISNNITVIGDCNRSPELYQDRNNKFIANYGLRVIRKYRIREDDVARRIDYPTVKSYGNIAKNDEKFIRKGSRIFIDGFVMSRQYLKEITCEVCGTKYQTLRNRTEIVPYSVEYLSDCNDGFETINNEVDQGVTENDE